MVAVTACLSAATFTTFTFAQGIPQRDPQRPGAEEIYKVGSFDELEPKTANELALAKYFRMGTVKLRAPDAPPSVGFIAGPPDPVIVPPDAKPDPDKPLRDQVCRVDAVAVGQISSRKVLLNATGTWLFTMYTVQVKSALRPVSLPSELTLGIRSGVVEVSGKTFRRGSQTLPVAGRTYLLYALRVPESGVYFMLTPSEVQWPANSSLQERLGKIHTLASQCR